MFTGLVEKTGKIERLKRGSGSARLTIACDEWDSPVGIGDSIAVQGACLTVSSVKAGLLSFDVLDETLSLTTLRNLKSGEIVNLERALKADGRLGGHFVSGHVDGVGSISRITKTNNDRTIDVTCPGNIAEGLVLKGSVALDGISLTITAVTAGSFQVKIIPHTWGNTSLRQLKSGSKVNIETDIIGKYVAKYMASVSQRKAVPLGLAALVKAGFDA